MKKRRLKTYCTSLNRVRDKDRKAIIASLTKALARTNELIKENTQKEIHEHKSF